MHSEKDNPANKPQTLRMLRAGLGRAGRPEYADHKPSDRLSRQSASCKRRGDNTYPDYPDITVSNRFEPTGKNGTGTKKGTRNDCALPELRDSPDRASVNCPHRQRGP